MLAQTSSKNTQDGTKSAKKANVTEFANYNKRYSGSPGGRNIILLICVIVQVLACCTLGKVCIPPLASETKLEYNSREHQLKMEKNKFVREIVRN